MVLPGGSVRMLYWPVRCSATPQAEMAPVHDDSLVGLAFCAVGSGIEVLTIQSALPAVSAKVSSNRIRCRVAACAGRGVNRAGAVSTAPALRAARAMTVRVRIVNTLCDGGDEDEKPQPTMRCAVRSGNAACTHPRRDRADRPGHRP